MNCFTSESIGPAITIVNQAKSDYNQLVDHLQNHGCCCLSMVYSQSLAQRVRDVLTKRRGIAERKMFGGVAFLLHGNMLVGIWRNSLIVRLGPEQAASALRQPFVVEFDITGKPMKGWVMVEPDGLDADQAIAAWIELAEAFVSTLPSKAK